MCLKLCKTKKVKMKDGRVLTIRRPRMSDVKKATEYVNSLIEENAMIKINVKQTVRQETVWLKGLLRDMRKNKKHALVGEVDGTIVSVIELRKEKWRQSHVATVGLGVKREYRRLGVATAMMRTILDIGKKDKDIKVIYLDVYENNKPAIKLYKKLGFKKVAKLKNRVQYKGKLRDQLIMDFER
jgi:ribosomal protein S18 acetylase RimI-like enzyme